MRTLEPLFLIGGAAAQITISTSAITSWTYAYTVTELVYTTLTTCPCSTSTSWLSSFTTVTQSPTEPDGTSTSVSALITTRSGVASTLIPLVTSTHSSVSSSGYLTTSVSTTSPSFSPIGSSAAYINQILRHHNVHRANHSAPDLVWSAPLAETARKIAETCEYGHVTDVDGGGYGQNIGAGYPGSVVGMASFITMGLYNSEVNAYTYYGGEPQLSTLNAWGHFSQVVWKATTSVGCHTADCTMEGLAGVTGNVPPFFTVCNYSPPGNFVGQFAQNVGVSIGTPSVGVDY